MKIFQSIPIISLMILLLSGGIFERVQADNIPNLEGNGYLKKQKKPRKPVQRKVEEINYDLLVKDIVQIIKWLEEPDITRDKLRKKLINSNYKYNKDVDESVDISIQNKDLSNLLSSKKYLEEVVIFKNLELNRADDKIQSVQLIYKESYQRKISASKLHLIVSGQATTRTRWRYHNCDGEYCPRTSTYFSGIDDKYLHQSGDIYYTVTTRVYEESFNSNKEIIWGTSIKFEKKTN
jgi:hypothetical protein